MPPSVTTWLSRMLASAAASTPIATSAARACTWLLVTVTLPIGTALLSVRTAYASGPAPFQISLWWMRIDEVAAPPDSGLRTRIAVLAALEV